MSLRYAGTCHVCGGAVAAGETAFYDQSTRRITCSTMACADADGLTRDGWVGSPASGHWAPALSDRRIGSGYVRDPGEDMADRWNESH
jgi:hypothetical protein